MGNVKERQPEMRKRLDSWNESADRLTSNCSGNWPQTLKNYIFLPDMTFVTALSLITDPSPDFDLYPKDFDLRSFS